MALHLNDGSLGDSKITHEFHLAVSPETFGDVGHDGNGRPLNLIPQAKIL
jgi:hypothetical protein